MKIALVITRLDKGGSSDVVLTLFEKLTKKGHDVTLIHGFTVDYPVNFKDVYMRKRDNIINVMSLQRNINPFLDLKALFELTGIMRKNHFQIVHTNSSKAGFIGRLAARLAGVKIIIHSPHGHIFYSYFGKIQTSFFIFLEKIAALFTDKIINLTELGKKDHVKARIAKPDKFIPIYCGIDLNKFLPERADKDETKRLLKISPEEVVVGLVSRFDPIKGCEYFIKAIPAIKKQVANSKFVMVGDGPLKDALKKLAAKLNISKDIVFTGYQSEASRYLNIFDVYVLSSLNEGLGRSIIEAMASGKPCVATNVGGVPEIVKDNVTGILVAPKSANALALGVAKLLKDKGLREKMGREGRERAKEFFGVELLVEKTENLYKELAKSKGIT